VFSANLPKQVFEWSKNVEEIQQYMAESSGTNLQTESGTVVTSPLRHFSKSQLLDGACFIGIFALSMFFGWLLSLAYPWAIFDGETPGYVWIGVNFHWFSANALDWWRTIPYGLVIAAATTQKNPGSFIFWLNTSMFSLSSALVYCLGRQLFNSFFQATALALAALLFEVVSMRIFFNDLHIAADPFFSQLIYLGVLLALLGWLRASGTIFVCAYLLFGIAIFTKPIGIALLPEWLIFALLCGCHWSASKKKRQVIALVSVVAMVAPWGLWLLRNFCVYGQASSGAGGCSLLLASLPVLRDDDVIFENGEINAEFIKSVRECEKGKQLTGKLSGTCAEREMNYERYFVWDKGPQKPFEIVAKVTNSKPNRLPNDSQSPPIDKSNGDTESKRSAPLFDSAHMFRVDKEAGRVAMRLISSHPADYARRTWREYVDMFSPLTLSVFDGESFQTDSSLVYAREEPDRWSDFKLFPGTGRPIVSEDSKAKARVIGKIICAPTIKAGLDWYYANEFVLSHAVFFAAVICLAIASTYRSKMAISRADRAHLIVLIMLFLTACLNYALISLGQVARKRYTLAGDPELHLMLILVFFIVIRWFATRAFSPALKVTIRSKFLAKRNLQ
jgi:hypothetical protein